MDPAPRPGSIVRSSTIVSVTGSAPERKIAREVFRLLLRIVERYLAPIAGDRFADIRCGNDLIIQQDREGPPHIVLRQLGKSPGTLGIKAKGQDGTVFVVARLDLEIAQIGRRQHFRALYKKGVRRVVLRIDDPRARRHGAAHRILRRHAVIDQVEGKPAILGRKILEPLRVGETRHLHGQSIRAAGFDDRIDPACLDGTAANDIDRLCERRQQASADRPAGDLQRQLAIIAFRERDVGIPGSGCRSDQRRQNADGPIDLVRIGDADLNGLPIAGEARIANSRFAQPAAHARNGVFEPLLDDVGALRLQHDMRTALKIEAEGHPLVRHPARQRDVREKIWGGAERRQQRQ